MLWNFECRHTASSKLYGMFERGRHQFLFSVPGRPIDQYQSSVKCNENKALSRLVGPQLFIGYFTASTKYRALERGNNSLTSEQCWPHLCFVCRYPLIVLLCTLNSILPPLSFSCQTYSYIFSMHPCCSFSIIPML